MPRTLHLPNGQARMPPSTGLFAHAWPMVATGCAFILFTEYIHPV